MILTEKHNLVLNGPSTQGAQISARVLAVLLEVLTETAQRTLRLRVEGRSNLHGKAAWIDDATDFYIVGFKKGSTVVQLEAPTLGDVAPKAFEHLPLWENAPKREQTAFTLVEEVLRDAMRGERESHLLDRAILETVAGLHKFLNYGFDSLTLNNDAANHSPVSVTTEGLAIAEKMRAASPLPVRTVVSGCLDKLSGSDRAFELQLSNGSRLRGILPNGDPAQLGAWWTKKVVVDGEAIFKPSGVPSRLIATHIQLAAPSDDVYGHLPRPRPQILDDLKPVHSLRAGETGFGRILGRWAGDETDEQFNVALVEMS